MSSKIQFDASKAKTYRKRTEVLAFQSQDGVTFFKDWGEQKLRPGFWIIVPLTLNGETTRDIYGVDGDVFKKTYASSNSENPNQYRKKETIQAYQPGTPFEVDNVLKDGYVEASGSKGAAADTWLVQGPEGDIYPIENDNFQRTYEEQS